MNLAIITPIIITYNEEANIGRVLDGLRWAQRIIVVDSHSTDNTLDICRAHPQVFIVQHDFTSFSEQCNFALTLVQTEWVLSLDADYVLNDIFVAEIQQLNSEQDYSGYSARFKFCVFGEPLHMDNTSRRTVLYRKASASYVEDGHQHRVVIDGRVDKMIEPIYHDDRKSLSRWLQSQDKYLQIEAAKVTSTPFRELDLADKIRKTIVLGPGMILVYCLIVQYQFVNGWRGLHYAFQRTLVELLLSIRLAENKISGKQ